jgi:CheY-like chemotaxis protein
MEQKSLSVLVVEDEYFIAAELAQILRDGRCAVVGPVSSIGDALALTDAEAIDCAVLDLNLDGDLAFDLARTLQKRDIAIVIVTGYDRSYIPETLGDVPVFQKPFIAAELLETLTLICSQT